MAVEKVHVLGINPVQQMIIRLALTEAFRRQAETLLIEAHNNPSKIHEHLEMLSYQLEHYETTSAGLPAPINMKNAKTKLVYLSGSAMRYLTDAINTFEPASADVDEDFVKSVERAFPKVKSLVNTSAMFDYTADDIRRANLDD